MDLIKQAVLETATFLHGPSYVEDTYQGCLAYHLRRLGFKVEREKEIEYRMHDGAVIGKGRMDLYVVDKIPWIIEIKVANGPRLTPKAKALLRGQLTRYLRHAGTPVMGMEIVFGLTFKDYRSRPPEWSYSIVVNSDYENLLSINA